MRSGYADDVTWEATVLEAIARGLIVHAVDAAGKVVTHHVPKKEGA
jgi:hypothetical protein